MPDSGSSSTPRNHEGFSIIEMLIVFTVVAVALLPLASIQFQSREQINEAARQARALQIAQGEIERVKMLGFAAATGDSVTIDQYSFATIVVPDPANPFMQEVRTTVTWRYGGEDHSITLASKQAARR